MSALRLQETDLFSGGEEFGGGDQDLSIILAGNEESLVSVDKQNSRSIIKIVFW